MGQTTVNEMKHSSCKLTANKENIEYYNNTVIDGALDITNLSNVLPTSDFVNMSYYSLFLLESKVPELITMNYDILATISTFTSGSGTVTLNNLHFRIYEVDYNGVEFTNPNPIHTNTFSITLTLTPFGASNNVNLVDSFTFTKQPNKVYFASVDALGQNWGLGFSGVINGTLDFEFENLIDDSTHSGWLIYECFQSLIEQMTDRTDVFYSELFGRSDLGYSSDGLASKIAVTNGLFLRNAEFSDGSLINLHLSFDDLYKSLDAIYGLSMWYDGEKIHIERRIDAFGNNEIELSPQEITRELFSELLYTNIKVGNKQIKYENVNGTNEHNTLLEFSTPLNIKSNNLDLVTKYQTDYLGIELARRLSFSTDNNVDTKYDDKVFLCVVELNVSQWESVIGFDGGYTTITGILLADYAGNLDFSPKRMLLNNSDLLSSALWKNTSDSVRFEKSENLAALVTKKTGEPSNIVELADVPYSQMNESLFIPMKWIFDVNENDLWKIMQNQLDVFIFNLGCQTIKGYLWKAEIQNDLGKITLIEKR